ncbi:MAG TPA: proton-conducting transporter membrane subunit [Turneriella sp.]|nr:proton-conducting transporter membrane subunit [Turneriella sp.]
MNFSAKDIFATLPQLVLVVGALVVLTSQLILKKHRVRIAWQLTVLTLIVTLLLVIFGISAADGKSTLLPAAFTPFDALSAFSGSLRYSSFSANSIVVFLALALAAAFMMRKTLADADLNFSENYFLLLMSVAGYSYAVCAEDLITFFIALELGSIPIIVLVGMNRKSTANNEASLKYLLLSAFAMAFFLLGIALIYGVSGTVRLRDIQNISPHYMRTQAMMLGYIFIFVGFFFKIGAFPLHSYIADVYEGSQTMFTGILGSLSKAGGLFLMFKIYSVMHDGFRAYMTPVLLVAAVGSLFYGAFASLGTRNLKRILAYSSISHAGFLLCFLVIPSGSSYGLFASFKQEAAAGFYIYTVGYTTASLLGFGVIAYAEAVHLNKEVLTLDNLAQVFNGKGLGSWSLSIATLSLLGMPPLAGFIGKFFLFKYLALSSNLTLAALAAIATAISLYAYIAIVKPIFFDERSTEDNVQFSFGDAGKVTLVAFMAVVGFFAVFTSFLYNTGITAMQRIF